MSDKRRYFLDRVMEDEREAELLAQIIAEWQKPIGQMRSFLDGTMFDDAAGLRFDPMVSAFRASPESAAQKNVIALTDVFFKAAARGDALTVLAFVHEGFPVNLCDEKTGETALHIAASSNARDVARVLIESGKCDYLLRDRRGYLPSDKAFLFGRNSALARLLAIKEEQQAAANGVTPSQ